MLRRAAAIAIAAVLVTAPSAAGAPVGAPAQVGDATALSTPWEVVRLPDGRTLVTEIPGRIRVIENGDLLDAPAYTDDDEPARKYLGLALSPDYDTNKFVYLYETRDTSPTSSRSRITRLTDTGTTLTDPTLVLGGIGSDRSHDGGRIAFGPDGYLYVTTGDIHDHSRPRNIDNLNGKILRMTEAGRPAPGNPFHTDGVVSARDYVWSYGHRHPQGIAWDGAGRLWETEHGPSGEQGAPEGASSGRDELNLIEPGKDYGWPAVSGDQQCANVETVAPVVHSGPAPAWAPADLQYVPLDGLLYAPALNGQHLHVFKPDGATVTEHAQLFGGTNGRLRAAALVAPDELWITTHTAPMKVLSLDLAAGEAGITWSTHTANPPEPKQCPPRTEDPPGGDAPTPPAGGGTATPPLAGTPVPAPPPVGDAGLPILIGPPAPAAGLVRTLVERTTSGLRRLRLRRLLRRGNIGVRAGGFAAGSRVTLRLQLRRSGRRSLTVASGVARPRSRSTITVRAKLTRRGRAALRRLRRARLALRVAYTPSGGAPVVRTATVTIRR